MIYLSGHTLRPDQLGPDLGVLQTPAMGNRLPEGALWAADTGSFASPESYDEAKYLAWLKKRQPHRSRCLFATGPDTLGDPVATWEQSRDVLPKIRALGFRAALVAQDGLEKIITEEMWDAADCLFIGGSTAWKLSEQSYALMQEGHERGLLVHVGRCNSFRRIKAVSLYADSCDGTYLKYGEDVLLPRLLRWMATLRREPSMEIA